MTAGTAAMLALATPLAGALAILATGRRPNLRDASIVVIAAAAFASNLSVLRAFKGGEPAILMGPRILPGLQLNFVVEPLGLVFALLASGLWIVTSLFAFGYMRGHEELHQTRFYFCFALAIFAATAIAYSANLFTLFVFYEVLTLSTYPLVTHHGTPGAVRAGRLYLGILMSTSIGLLLPAVIWTWRLAGTTDFVTGGILAGRVDAGTATALLALFVFGTGKVALMPVHRWLPAAMVAPTPVSALLHAVAVVKAGAFTVIKVGVYIFGLDTLRLAASPSWLLPSAAFTVLAGATVAIGKDNFKARLAYSTISQLAYMVLGVATATATGIVGAAMHMVMHAFAKITLFFCAGAIYVAAHETEVSRLNGLARRMPLVFLALSIGAAANVGLPLTGGLWSKWFLATGTLDAGAPLYLGVLMLSSLLALGYMAPILARGYFGNARNDDHDGDAWLERRHPLLVVAPLLTAAGCIALFFFAETLYHFLAPIAGGKP